MSRNGIFGTRLGKVFGLADPPSLVSRIVKDQPLAATEIRGDTEKYFGMTRPFPTEDAFLINVTLRDLPDHQSWEDGVQSPLTTMFQGQTTIHDLKRHTTVHLQHPFHSIHFYIPRSALLDMARSVKAPPIGDLRYELGVPMSDPVLMHLAYATAPVFRVPDHVSGLFVDAITRAVGAHVATVYGGLRPSDRADSRPGLAVWQERRAKDLLRASLGSPITIARLADECRLSPGHFTRAFRLTTGLPPHRWLVMARCEHARDLLIKGSRSLREVALAAGFADQSHMTRVFVKHYGVTPGAYRRHQGSSVPDDTASPS